MAARVSLAGPAPPGFHAFGRGPGDGDLTAVPTAEQLLRSALTIASRDPPPGIPTVRWTDIPPAVQHAMLKTVAEEKTPIIVNGDTWHRLSAATALYSSSLALAAAWQDCESLLQTIAASRRPGRMPEVPPDLTDVDLLVIVDPPTIEVSDEMRAAMLAILTGRRSRRTVIVSHYDTPTLGTAFGHDVGELLCGGIAFEIQDGARSVCRVSYSPPPTAPTAATEPK